MDRGQYTTVRMAAGYINSQITMPIKAAVVQIANTQISLRAIV
ncbi:hypothetical protein EK99P-1_0061 [Escherichia phage EK99P-1]|uniref:Uncharacterized protein n=1 Tax=Escherichia phage EK99P-1 TaxID=1527514 RepID=A0A076YME5_9CAUD|nr:hypothetical protein LD29_gp61 [Escherichia phage EK99P-1]AIK68773.1 hypothetical protein EK99P-1_0061 [Escherichia phage EK99P-1]